MTTDIHPIPSFSGTTDRHTADVSVIICAYTDDRWDDLLAAIRSVADGDVLPREVIVAVDHNPGLAGRLRSRLPELTVVENTGNRGLAVTRNRGIVAARGAIIAFLDDDARAATDWLSTLIAQFSHDDVIAVGGSALPSWDGERPSWFPEEFLWVVGCSYRGLPQQLAPVRNLIGCNMAFRREAFDLAGLFSDGIGRVGARPVGCEETELCIRMHQYLPDSLILQEPAARVWHRVTRRRATISYFLSRCYAEGLSKALVARLVGATDGLASERAYTLRILPSGVLKGLGDAVLRRDPGGAGRAAAIIAGLGCTVAGYAAGKIQGGKV